jgi:hypothetical protein
MGSPSAELVSGCLWLVVTLFLMLLERKEQESDGGATVAAAWPRSCEFRPIIVMVVVDVVASNLIFDLCCGDLGLQVFSGVSPQETRADSRRLTPASHGPRGPSQTTRQWLFFL